ncbi:unconventional myosin-XV [Candoia aspera]|uniref:unconventional myosin-XV n=1 Tax=Candoia aspera TaxID=51853 RepID=UPI002FD87A5A
MAKKGKEVGRAGKGKDVRKGKKGLVTQLDDGSDTDLAKSNTEESEMGSELVEGEEEENEDDPKKKKGKDKKGAVRGAKKGGKGKKGQPEDEEDKELPAKTTRQLKGASKLVMGLAADDAKKKKVAKKEHAKAQLKGATKAMAMAKKEPAAPPKKRRSLKSTSRLFMGMKGMGQQKSTKKSHFKSTSRFFWGLKKYSTKKKKKQKKNKGVLKSTSNLMMRFKSLGRKKEKKEATAGKETKKPSFMLIRLGGGKSEDRRSKGGGILGSLFRRRKANQNFKPQAQLVSKVAAIANWLTRKFLSKRGYRYDKGVTDESWLAKIGAKKLPFPSEDEVLRHRANMRRVPGVNRRYGQYQDKFGYWDHPDSARLQDYFDGYEEEQGCYDVQSPFKYGFSNYNQDCYGRHPMEEEYGPYDEAEDYDEQDPYEYHSDNQNYGPSFDFPPDEPYDDFSSDSEVEGDPYWFHYGRTQELEDPDEEEDVYCQQEVNDSEQDWVAQAQPSCNPYACLLDDIAEVEEADRVEAEPEDDPIASSHFSVFERGEKVAAMSPWNRKFRLFPRPQVKLFGKEKLDIPLPPSPQISLAYLDPEEEGTNEEEEQVPLISPFAQFDGHYLEPSGSQSTFPKLLPGHFVSKLQRPLGTNLTRRTWVRDPCHTKPHLSPRDCGSPLGQFPQQSISQPRPILKHHGDWGRNRPSVPEPSRRTLSPRFGKNSPLGPSSPQLPRRTFEKPSSTFPPRSVRRLSDPGKHNPIISPSHTAVLLRGALHEELQSTLPFIQSTSNKKSLRDLSFSRRESHQAAAKDTDSQRHSSPRLSHRSSPHMLARQGSHRISIRESPPGSSPYAQPPRETDRPTEAQAQPQLRWHHVSGEEIATPWNSSPKMGATKSLRNVSDLPRPPNQAPNTRKNFIQRIGQPLAGMAQAASPIQFLPAETTGHLEDRNPYLAQLGPSPEQSQVFSRQRFSPRSPAAVASVKQKAEAIPPRPSIPKVGHELLGGNLPCTIPGDNPGSLGRTNLSPLSQRMVSFKRPHTVEKVGSSLARPPSFHTQYNKPGRPDSVRRPTELLEDEMEGSIGRYAVVMPQVQRMGSSPRRRSQRQNQPWSEYHTVNVHEMPNKWTSEKLFQHPPAESFKAQAAHHGGERGRGRGSSVFWYLTRGASEFNNEHGETTRDRPCKMHSIHNLPSAANPGGPSNDSVDDLTQLEELQESVVLHNIKRRFERGLIYTYIGSILVSVNPYKTFNIYGTDHVLKYEGKALGENPPHLFAIANVAHSKLRDAKLNQCIIISGESGSGKTEATKLVLRYLAAINQKHAATQQILEATPLLESFGNAKTVRNDNSSRFGKFVEIFLEDSGLICGAITSQYLLEKSRVIFQAKNERNYHIFYEMLAGLPTQQKQAFCLQGAETYYYLNQGGNCEIPGKMDLEDFHRLLDTMEVLNFSLQDQDSIFRILSSILHLGNVYFEKYETDCQEVASVLSAKEIRVVAELLQISPEGLQKSVTYKVTETMREKIFTPLTVESAVDARDAVAKILYSLLFNWLMDRINKQMYPKQNTLSIAVLDIYGFEDLGFNSFEQLCINYANEYLQYFFNKIVFKEEQEEYIREQIEWREIAFADNQPCIELISQRPHGVLNILNDQSSFPQATDHTFLQKCHYHHSSNLLYSKPKLPLPEFSIRHYAGKVTYQVHKFLDKNYDQVRQDVLDLFVNSKIKMVASLFFSHAQLVAQQRTMMGKSSTGKRKYKPQTVAAKFQQSLLDLVEKMERCNPFFVRCIKPNNKKEPGLFEADTVSNQLRSSGILETIRIRKEGFPVRIPFQIFIDRYRCLVEIRTDIIPDGWNSVGVLKKLCPVTPEMYCIGTTKLFMKESIYQQLEAKREQMVHMAVVTLQRYVRGFLIKKRFYALRCKIILFQARARGYLVRQKYWRLRQTLIKFRCLVRIYMNRRRYLKRKDEERQTAEQEKRKAEQELSQREVMKVSHLEVPAELVGLLNTVAVHKQVNEDCVIPVPPPKMQADSQLTLPLDINNYPMAKYVQLHFKEPLFGMLTRTLSSPLTQLDDSLAPEALSLFKLILRFMGDAQLNGTQENLLGNYIVQKGLSMPSLQDEILAQIANQVWRNTNVHNEEQGWLLLASCISTFVPSPQLDKYLLKFVSDYAFDGYKPVCQHKLMQAMAMGQDGAEATRAYPPTLLEWTASRDRVNMALDVYCFNGDHFSCPVHSWTTGEGLAASVLKHRGLTDGWQGWSITMRDGTQWAELAGHDYVLDLISDLELIRGFPKQKSYFILASEDPEKNAGGKLVFQRGLDSDGGVPPPPLTKAPTVASANLPDSEGYCSHDSDTFSEPRSQKGLDHYLDSLFDPVLSYGKGELEKPAAISRRMKGGGRVGQGNGDDVTAGVPQTSRKNEETLLTQPAYDQQQASVPVSEGRNCPAERKESNQGELDRFLHFFLGQIQTVERWIQAPLAHHTSQPVSTLWGQQQQAVVAAAAGPSSPSGFRNTNPRSRRHRSPSRAQRIVSSASSSPTNLPLQGEAGRRFVGGSASSLGIAQRTTTFQKPESGSKFQAGELVRHSKLNSEHNPEPTQNIRNIIKQCQQPSRVPEPIRKEGGKVFVKKMDPHEEALMILKRQMAPTEVPRQPLQAVQETAPRETIAMVRPVASAKAAEPPAMARPFPDASSAPVSRALASEDEPVQTRLHRRSSEGFYGYHNVSWKIYLRKEVFYPKENISSPLLLDLLFRQIFNDTLSDACIRVTEGEKLHMKTLFAENKLDSFSPVADESVKKEIIRVARENWEVYFSRLFPATGSVGTGVQILAVSDTGIKLLRLVKGANLPGEQVRVLRGYSYSELLFVSIPSKNMLEFNLVNEKLILFSPKAVQVKALIDHFIMELKKDSQYMVAIKNHITNAENFLSFHKGDIICLRPMEGLEPDHCYGCVVRKKVMLLEEVKKGTLDFGWKFGAIYGKSGLFPASCVQPVAAPDFTHLPTEKKEDPNNKQAKVAGPASVAVAVASAAVAQELDRKVEVSPGGEEYLESWEEFKSTPEKRPQGGPFTMLEFAKKYFREGQRAKTDKQKSKKGVESKSVADVLKYTKCPIQESLIGFTNSSLNKIAAESFQAVMKFMGDLPLRGLSELDVVYTLLKLCGDHEVIRDEVFCQILKQITDNVSSKMNSCQRGWKLLYILSAYYRCSEVFKPYLLQFLQEVSGCPGLHFQGIAKACEQNLWKTFKFGGRCEFPSNVELRAVVVGRSSKRQLFLLPGGIERHLKIKTCSVAQDVIEEICFEMGLHQPEAFREYIIFAVSSRNQNVRPLDRREYILDVAMEMENVDSSYMFWYRRVIWTQPLKFDNELYVTIHYNQVLPDYLKGLFSISSSAKPSEQQFQQVSKLAALQLWVKGLATPPEIQDYIPPQFYHLQTAQAWLDMVAPYLQQAQALSAHQARAQFLGLLSAFPTFGSSFFYIQSCSNNTIISPCILAVNQNGLNFLNKETHEPIATFALKEIHSTRTQRAPAGSSYPNVEIMLGDLMSCRITQLQLKQGLELCRVIATHMESLLHAREKRLTLPPSEITLL